MEFMDMAFFVYSRNVSPPQSHEDILPCFLPEPVLLFFSHEGLQVTWNLFLCMVCGKGKVSLPHLCPAPMDIQLTQQHFFKIIIYPVCVYNKSQMRGFSSFIPNHLSIFVLIPSCLITTCRFLPCNLVAYIPDGIISLIIFLLFQRK